MNTLTPIGNPDDYRETEPEPVTFRATANKVTERFFGRRPGDTDLERGDNDPFSPGWADRYGRAGTGVQRTAEANEGEQDMDLPRYGELLFCPLTIQILKDMVANGTGDNRGTTAIKAPERAYNPSAPPRSTHIDTQTPPGTTETNTRDAPPQYDRAISTPAITGPPVVTNL